MRLAIVAASSYEENGQVAPIPNAELDVELFGGRLAEADAGFAVHAFSAQRGLPEGIEELVASLGQKPHSLVFYFWGYALLSQERGPTLLLDGPKLSSFTLARLRRLLSELADVALVVLDATLAAGSFGSALDAVRAMGAALSNADSNISSLIAVRSPDQRAVVGPPPFTGLLQLVLDAQTGSPLALTPGTLFRAMQSEEVMFADIPAAGCFLGQREFVLVPAAKLSMRSVAPSPEPATTSYDDADEVTAPRAEPRPAPAQVSATAPPPPPPPLPRPSARVTATAAGAESLAPAAASSEQAMPSARQTLESFPRDPASTEATYCRQLLAEFERTGDADGAYRAALCLEALGEADINESLLATTNRPDGLQAVRGALSYADWNERLCSGCDEPHITAILRALAVALPRIGFQHTRRMRRELILPDDARQELTRNTTTLAKTLHWTSRLLSVNISDFYVLPEAPASVLLVPGIEAPEIACGRGLGSGFSLPELVCLWARELSFLRPEQAALCYFSDAAELAPLISAALASCGVIQARTLDADAKRLLSALKREVRGAALDALRVAAEAFPVHEVPARSRAFVRAAELVANRVALVASGDLELTLALEQRFPRDSLTLPEERRADLLGFTLSRELGEIRAALGVAVR